MNIPRRLQKLRLQPIRLRPRTKLIIVFAVLVGMILAGFFLWYLPHRPDAIFAKSVLATLNQQSVEFRVVADGPTPVNLKAAIDKHGTSSIVFAKDGQQFTIVSNGTTAYIQGQDGKWLSLPMEKAASGLLPGTTSAIKPTGLDHASRQRLERLYNKQPFMEVVRVLADEPIDGQACYHYQVMVNKQKLRVFLKSVKNDIPKLAIEDTQIAAIANASLFNKPFEVWINANTGLLRQIAYVADDDGTVHIVFDSFGKDDEIAVPQSAAPLLDTLRR